MGVPVGSEKTTHECAGKWGSGPGVEACLKVETDIIDYPVDATLEDSTKPGSTLEPTGCSLAAVLAINSDKELPAKTSLELKNVPAK